MLPAMIAGIGAGLDIMGTDMQIDAAVDAATFNAEDAEFNAQLAYEKAKEDERQFRMSFRQEQATSRTKVGASGVKLEGSPLEALRSNAILAEQDAQAIRKQGMIQRNSFLRRAGAFRLQAAKTEASRGFALLSSGLGGASAIMKASG